jgi:hypothetical protein
MHAQRCQISIWNCCLCLLHYLCLYYYFITLQRWILKIQGLANPNNANICFANAGVLFMMAILVKLTQQHPISRELTEILDEIAEILEAGSPKMQSSKVVQFARKVTEGLVETYEPGTQFDAAVFVSSVLERAAGNGADPDNFTTEIHAVLSCQTCTCKNPAQIFHYPLHCISTQWMKPTLEESIKAYLSPCSMDRSTWPPLGCKCANPAIVTQNVIVRTPKFIVFHLVRGNKDDADPDTKDSAVLVYPLILDFNGEYFKLKSVCVHVGKSVTEGHYWTICEGDDGLFYNVNDLKVTNVQVPSGKKSKTEAYMLCYEKCPFQTCG